MPPQPLRSIRRNATAIADANALARFPAMAAQIGTIVAVWSRVESLLGTVLAFMLKSGIRVSMAMYSVILNSQIQMAVLKAAAKVVLTPDDFKLFSAVLILVNRAGQKRHKLAHWSWGYSPEITDALILIDPDAVLDFISASSEFVNESLDANSRTPPPERLDLSRAFVYRERELLEIISEIIEVEAIVRKFVLLAANPARADEPRSQLLAMPQIQGAMR
jgi:hypothetical protein